MSRALALLRRVPFAIALLLAMIGVALLSGTHLGPLEARWLARLGVATSDLRTLELERIATSALATYGGAAFWRALLAVALFVGAAEWRFGTRRTAALFSASHVLTLLALAPLVGLALPAWHPGLAERLDSTRDVGPSAGYFGCLALLCSGLPARSKRLAGVAIEIALCAVFGYSLARAGANPTDMSAALSHVIAFPLGWVLAKASAGRVARSSAAVRRSDRRTGSDDQRFVS
jgi:hypothetical protein